MASVGLEWLAVGSEPARTPSRLVRWLANDDRRYWVASVIPILPAFGVLFTHREDSFHLALLYVMAFWSLWCVCYVAVTCGVFGHRTASEFSDLIGTSTPRRTTRVRVLLGLRQAAGSFGTQVSILMVVLMVAVFVTPSLRSDIAIVVLAACTVAASWVHTTVSYAIEYARADHRRPGLDFPGDERPSFGDYLYHAAAVNATFATSDVSVVSGAMRRLTTTHTLIAFGFNSVILAMLITLLTVTLR